MYSFGSLLWYLSLVYFQRIGKSIYDGYYFSNDSDCWTFVGFCICKNKLPLFTNRFAFWVEFVLYGYIFQWLLRTSNLSKDKWKSITKHINVVGFFISGVCIALFYFLVSQSAFKKEKQPPLITKVSFCPTGKK